MAIPTAVNGQITDAITQQNLTVLGSAPGQAIAVLYQTMAQNMALAAQNAVTQQQQLNMVSQAATVQGVNQIYQAGKS